MDLQFPGTYGKISSVAERNFSRPSHAVWFGLKKEELYEKMKPTVPMFLAGIMALSLLPASGLAAAEVSF